MEQTTSRLRKTFHYPTDGDSDDNLPEALDEEEQESLIHTLHLANTTRNKQYAQLLLALPLTSILPYLPTLITPPTTLLSILSITSLLSTAYLLYSLPPGITSIPFLDNHSHSYPSTSTSTTTSTTSKARQNPSPPRIYLRGDGGPIATYLPYLNLGLCIVLVGLGSVVGRRHDVWWGFGWLPAGVQGVVLLAKWIMGGVDPERELGSLKYGFKGA